MHRFFIITELSHVSHATLATALVVPFENLRMTDVESVGGKNASLGEMISQLAAAGVRVPGGFATTAHAFRDFLAARRPGRAHRRRASRRSTSTTCARSPRPAPRSASWIERHAVPAALEAGDPREFDDAVGRRSPSASLRGALVGHRRRPARRLVRRPAGDLPQRRRHRRRAATACSEVFASLYNDRAIAYRVHKGFAHADVALSAGVQRMVRSDLGAAGVMFTLDTESRLQRRRVHHLELRPGRDGGAGRGQPGRVLRLQADAAAPASTPIIRRNLGSQADQDGVRPTESARPASSVQTVDVPHRAAQPLLADRRRRRSSWRATR